MPDRILVPLIVACALFMENLDSTVLSTALPVIAEDFGANPIHLKLALTSYLLSLAVFIPASGWFADRYGSRVIFQLAIVTFTVGSILCALSGSIGEIVFARVIQGIGGALMVPVGRLVILKIVPKHELVGSLAWLTIPALVGPVVGPPVGGFIATYADWPWIFWINVPIGVLGLILATLHIPDVRGETRSAFDLAGFLLAGIGLSSFMTGSTAFGLNLLPGWLVVAMLFGGAALLVAYVVHARGTSAPIVDLSLLAIPSFRWTLIGGMLLRIGIGATPFLLPLLLQLGFGMSAFQSGMITFASAVGAITVKTVAPWLLRRHGFRRILIVNALIAGFFVALPAAFTAATPIALMTGLLLVGGFSRSLQFTGINALNFADVPLPMMSAATSLTSVVQQLSLSVGISIGAVVLEIVTAESGGLITASSFWPAFIVVGLITALSAVPFAWLDRDAGHEVSGRKPLAPDPVTVMRERG
jgi:EmrB/QacA subfamily drug resistance transporter